ncbi:mycofactocin biosynthesis peptidyl-dipeptidase MftE [uncultured Jatrophihabitans sp.]|uniref:mycofactocin biosynthesis peptidyl-dipeptidase MftE n=1 Tax=uncultured Jatrophihabitans sp. TaxID=1610747 RepID=UPI0035C9E09D
MSYLAHLTFAEVGVLVADGAILVVPLGSTEQHGAHLPLTTDTDVAQELCERLRAARSDIVIAPAVSYGSSGEHSGFAGTLSIGAAVLEHLVLELGRSAGETFSRIAFVNGHGGNSAAAARAVRLLQTEGRDVRLFQPRYRGDAHAGRTETSMMLALRPESVRRDHAVPGDTRPLTELLPLLRAGGVRAVTATGVLGDPTGAGADEGHALLDDVAAAMLDDVTAWAGRTAARSDACAATVGVASLHGRTE